MENSEDKFCRLCLVSIKDDNFKRLEGNTREVFGFLLPSLILDEGNKQVLCDGCSSKLFKAYNFKAICLETEDTLSPYINLNKTLMYDLKEIYIIEKGEKDVNPWLKDQKVCRLCLQLVSYKFIRLEDDTEFYKFIPEVQNFKVTADPVICQNCYDSLFTYSNFIKGCLAKEKQKSSISPELDIKTEEIDIKTEENEIAESEEVEQISVAPMYECDKCTYTTNHKPHLKRHVLVHQDEHEAGMYRCSECNYQTKLKRDLNLHQMKHKDPSQVQVYKCTQCKYVTFRKYSLRRHELIHKDLSEISIYKCSTCEFQTKYKRNILKHQLQHVAQKYKCHNCDSEEEQELRQTNSSEAELIECKKCRNEAQQSGFVLLRIYAQGV